MLYPHDDTWILSRWNNGCNDIYKKESIKTKTFWKTSFLRYILYNFSCCVTMCIYINIEYWPEHSFNKHHNIETLLGFPIFVFTFRPSSIYVISMWSIFHFHLHFQYDSLWTNTHYRLLTGRGRCAFPAIFRKLEKKVPHYGETLSWFWSSVGKISHLKCNFSEFPGKKIKIFSLRDFCFWCCRWRCIKVP